MKCNLTSLIDAAEAGIPPGNLPGDMALQISDLQGLTRTIPPPGRTCSIPSSRISCSVIRAHRRKAPCSVLATPLDPAAQSSVLPALILVLCPEPSRVYAALSRILFQEGVRSSQMPEVSAAFLRCRSMDALIERGYAYLGNPFAIHNSDGKLLAYSRQAGLRDAAWKSEAFSLHTLSVSLRGECHCHGARPAGSGSGCC